MGEPIPYDFRKPWKCRAKNAASLDAIQFSLAAALRNSFANVVEITLGPLESMQYDEFLASIPSPGSLCILRVDPPGAQICVHLTEEVERHAIIERFCPELADNFKQMTVREEERFSDPQDARARIMPADEMVTVMRFDSSVNQGGGIITLCLPMPVINMLQGVAPDSMTFPQTLFDRERDADNLKQNIMQTAVELCALLAKTKLRPDDVLSMHVGDVITTEAAANDLVAVQVEGRKLFAGEVGQLRGTRAIEVTRAEDLGGAQS